MNDLPDLADAFASLADAIEGDSEFSPHPHDDDGAPPQPSPDDSGFSDSAPQPLTDQEAFEKTLAECAELDQSDTSNGRRLIAYLGADIIVMQQSGISGGDFLTWSGQHWDLDGGAAGAAMLAQRVGDLIQLEADHMSRLPHEVKAIEAGEVAKLSLAALAAIDADDLTDAQTAEMAACEAAIEDAKAARAALSARKKRRRDFGVSSKNGSRLKNMLDAAAPHLRKPIDAFNADPLLVATRSHTLRLIKETDPECPDETAVRYTSRLIAEDVHRRSDYITALVPVDYRQGATAKHWTDFLERMLPDELVRRTVRQFAGLGLLGLPVQKFMFHYGEGANGKSVFLETLVRLLGKSFAVGLPTESIIGAGDRNAGGASPDLFRLFGKRMVRILEMPEGKPLQSELIKKLTGGEEIPVRTLFKGFIDFQPRAKPHMSGNGLPKITDTSNGIWRRMLFVKWPVILAEHEQRDLEDVVGELLSESSGILNWLLEGALDYLANGLYVAPSVAADTQEYRKEMDIVMQFYQDCVEAAPGESVRAREMYNAFKAWCDGNAKAPLFETKFGLNMKRHCKRDEGRVRRYLDVRLHDVPTSADRPGEPPHPADIDDEVPL